MSRVDFEVPARAVRERCRSCAAPVAFIKTAKGKAMPLDLNTVEIRDGKEYAESHFAKLPTGDRLEEEVKSTESTMERIERLLAVDQAPTEVESPAGEQALRQRNGAVILAHRVGIPVVQGHPLVNGFLIGVRIAAVCGITLSMLERIEYEHRAKVAPEEGKTE